MVIPRAIYPKLKEKLDSGKVLIITGARQAGKTTLLEQLENDLKNRGKPVAYFNLDFSDDLPYFKSQTLLLNQIEILIGRTGYVFIDEIQRLPDAGRFLKGLYDKVRREKKYNYKFVVTGSGSLELKEYIGESLAGRKRLFRLETLTFSEFVNYKTEFKYGLNKISAYLDQESYDVKLMYLLEYLSFGGYPEVVTSRTIEQKREAVEEIVDSYIEKDIVDLMNVRKDADLVQLISFLAAGFGSLIHYEKLGSKVGISFSTLKKYLSYLEKTYSISQIRPYFGNKNKELVKNPVFYFNDFGFRNYSIDQFNLYTKKALPALGMHFQNYVYLTLRRIVNPNYRLKFWRTKRGVEVDFVLERAGGLIGVESKCRELDKPKLQRSADLFIKRYQPRLFFVVNLNLNDEAQIDDTHVKFISFDKLDNVPQIMRE